MATGQFCGCGGGNAFCAAQLPHSHWHNRQLALYALACGGHNFRPGSFVDHFDAQIGGLFQL